jgi:vanillate O-demethylase ferredoxin subunit
LIFFFLVFLVVIFFLCLFLEVVEAEGIDWQFSCREGTCGSCEARILSGQADHRDAILSPEERRANETMMICVSRSKSETLELDI